ncbi:MAG TPA: M1 family metallopeptidase [Terriglobales bacterium]|nr:M1 family metallopeptidase [Terriglobales bacterium]
MKKNIQLVPVKDVHTYARPEEARVTHVDLDLAIDFQRKVLEGSAILTVQRSPSAAHAPVVLDSEKLAIKKIEVAKGRGKFSAAKYELGATDKILGTPLTVQLPPTGNQFRVKVTYATEPSGSGLQWLAPAQTVGKKHPYFFTQSEAIHARSWVPLQDTPGVRVTYDAKIKAPDGLVALMGAAGNTQSKSGADPQGGTRTFTFHMDEPIPSYLIALAVGDITFRPLGKRAGVYDEPAAVDRDAKELEDVEQMIAAAEKLYGPYRWGRYDVLILPPGFPYGGMENPRLTFASPTIIAGDKSLVSVIAHELAHSWSGNLVTNATWSDFWLNEGFTTYIERRIIEKIYGKGMAEMQTVLGRQILDRDVAKFEPKDQLLHIDLQGRDPDDGSTELPYEKGSLFLRHLEDSVGRGDFDRFLNSYFQNFAFHSITTQDFLNYLDANLLKQHAGVKSKVPIEEWINQPGVPASAPKLSSDAFAKVEAEAAAWSTGKKKASELSTREWSTQEWLHFLKALPTTFNHSHMAELDQQFHFTRSGNIEIADQWLLMSIRNGYREADLRLEEVLRTVGRRKIVKPLYEELAKTPEGKQRALAIYAKARSGYHPILSKEVDAMLGYSGR